MNKFTIHMSDILRQNSLTEFSFGCNKEVISETVVIAPNWKVDIFNDSSDSIKEISSKAYTVKSKETEFTFIRTGMGASFVGDSILALAGTKCKNVIFAGSVGGLKDYMRIGDIVIPNYSICGEGFSRYLEEDLKDCFGEKYYPCVELTEKIYNHAKDISNGNVAIHFGITYSSDTILAEYMNLDRIKEFECNSIEMETSAFYKAASYMKLKATAILMILDNTIEKKPLFINLSENDKILKKNSKFNLIPNTIIKTIEDISKDKKNSLK